MARQHRARAGESARAVELGHGQVCGHPRHATEHTLRHLAIAQGQRAGAHRGLHVEIVGGEQRGVLEALEAALLLVGQHGLGALEQRLGEGRGARRQREEREQHDEERRGEASSHPPTIPQERRRARARL